MTELGPRLIDGRGTKWDFQKKTQCFLTFLIFALFQTTAKQHFIAFFSSLFQKSFQLF